MPDILIRMKMPHNCFQCPLSVLNGERLFCKVTKEEVLRAKLAPECPLVELSPHGDLIETNIFDQEEIHHNCTVQILKNSVTGEVSVGWWENDNQPIGMEGSD